MPMQRYKPEQIVTVLRQIEVADLPPGTSPPSKLDPRPFEVHSKGLGQRSGSGGSDLRRRYVNLQDPSHRHALPVVIVRFVR